MRFDGVGAARLGQRNSAPRIFALAISDQMATAQLAVDGQVEESTIPHVAGHLEAHDGERLAERLLG